jgi:hypothetical protein
MDLHALVSRSWNDTPISRRTSDGYINATAMCKANKKRWSDYRESDRCQTYLGALSQTTKIPVFDLIESRQVKSYRRIWLLATLKRLPDQLADR